MRYLDGPNVGRQVCPSRKEAPPGLGTQRLSEHVAPAPPRMTEPGPRPKQVVSAGPCHRDNHQPKLHGIFQVDFVVLHFWVGFYLAHYIDFDDWDLDDLNGPEPVPASHRRTRRWFRPRGVFL